MAAALNVDWEVGKRALAAGVPMAQVAESLGVKFRSLQKRAQRGENGVPWFIPGPAIKRLQREQAQAAKAIQKQQEAAAKGAGLQNAQCLSLSQGPIPKGKNGGGAGDQRDDTGAKTAALVLQTLGKNEEKASLMASNIATQLIEQAATSKKHKLARLEDVQDLAKALGVVRTANGSDKEDGKVTVNLFAPQGGGGPIDAASRFRRRVIDVEAVPQE
jgi:hypothetical protein